MNGVYVGLIFAALFVTGIIVYIVLNWKKWTAKQRKYSVAGVFGSIAIVTVLILVSSSMSMTFAKPSELFALIKKGEIKLGEQIKVEGEIVPGTIKTYNLGNTTEFSIKDKKAQLKILYNGVLPDNFKPGIQAVAVGSYDGKIFKTDDVKTKCPSKYKAVPKSKKKEK